MKEQARLVIIILSVIFFVNHWSASLADSTTEDHNIELKGNLDIADKRYHELNMLIARSAITIKKLEKRINKLETEYNRVLNEQNPTTMDLLFNKNRKIRL